MDQAGTLRKIMNNRPLARPLSTKQLKVISVTSGKGGVGKTNLVANLALALQRRGEKVLVLDGDFGLANMNIIMGLDVKGTIYDVLTGNKAIEDIVLKTKTGVSLLPSSSGIFKMSNLSVADKSILMEKLEGLSIPFDYLLIDTGAGINSDVMYLNAAASEVLVISTPEPTSIADAYALMKVMSREHNVKRFKLIVNMANNEKEGQVVYQNLLEVADRFLNISIEYLGCVEFDRKVSQCVVSRKLVLERYPDIPTCRSIESIAQSIQSHSKIKSPVTGNMQFFWRTLMTTEVSV